MLLSKSNLNYASNLIYLLRTIPPKLKKQKASIRYTVALFRSNFLLPNIIRCYSVIMGRILHNGKIVCMFTGIYIYSKPTFSWRSYELYCTIQYSYRSIYERKTHFSEEYRFWFHFFLTNHILARNTFSTPHRLTKYPLSGACCLPIATDVELIVGLFLLYYCILFCGKKYITGKYDCYMEYRRHMSIIWLAHRGYKLDCHCAGAAVFIYYKL